MDTSVPLQEQEYSEGVSWFDFFMDMAKRYAQETLAFCEAARAQGLSLDQDTLDQIQSTLDNLDVYAVTAGYDDTALYIEASYGPGVTRQALEDYITKNALASLYLSSLESSFTYTQEDLTAAVEADPRAYEVVDCAYFTYSVDEGSRPHRGGLRGEDERPGRRDQPGRVQCPGGGRHPRPGY